MSQSQKQKIQELCCGFDTAVLVTHTGKLQFRARPMAIADVDENCDVWFISSLESAKIHEIKVDTRVQVVCQNGWSSCVCIAGRASLSYDKSKLNEIWKPSYQVWFPKGVNDNDIVLIHVVGEQAEYWDNTGMNQITYVYEALKAVVTGTTPQVREGDQHGHVKLAKAR